MSVAKDKKDVAMFSNELEMVSAVYDFAQDGGAISVIDLMEMKQACVLHRAWVKVHTGVTSTGAPTVEIGVKGGDTDAIMVATLKGALLANTAIDGDAASKGLYLASGAVLSAEIKVEVLTAGKIELVCLIEKF